MGFAYYYALMLRSGALTVGDVYPYTVRLWFR